MIINGLTVLISGSYNVFNEGWNGAGVYMASGNYKSETFKEPIYIGSSENLQRRIIYRHIPELNCNEHNNKPFQYSWNKHAQNEGFIWFLLEGCEKENTLIVEQKYLDLYQPFIDEFGGFNIGHYAEAPQKGRKMSEETKKKLSLTKKALKIKMNKEQKEHLRRINLGKKWKPESLEKRTESQSKEYEFIDPDGKIVKIKNLRKFCRENNLDSSTMCKVDNEKIKYYKGWRKVSNENLKKFVLSEYYVKRGPKPKD